MIYKYLDDEPAATVRSFIRSVEDKRLELSIKHDHPSPYSQQLVDLQKSDKNGELDGLILDLRLDQFFNTIGSAAAKADYRASTLAQEIRTRATEKKINEFPIVLWSTDKRLSKSYDKDDTSHDLFDMKVVKNDLEDPKVAKGVSLKLVALVEGYRELKTIRAKIRGSYFKFLGLPSMPDFLDDQIYMHLKRYSGSLPVHEYARFIIKEMLETPGPIIDDYTLAARLGISIDESLGFDKAINKIFSDAKYVGPFSRGWNSWWMPKIDSIWRSLPNCPGPLRTLDAEERVSFIKKISGVKMIFPYKPSKLHRESNYWTVCRATLKPLNPSDGFMIDRQPKYTWQDRWYVSLEALLSGEAKEKDISLDELEEIRYKRVVKKLKSSE